MTVFMFWELSSFSSFFLIGFNNEYESSRKSVMTDFAIIRLGDFVLLARFLLIAKITGSFTIQELMSSREILQNNSMYILILIFIFGGAFTKSAQFPFHFWLP